eukprot:792332-Pyramimonas_sp.AAC.1
MRHGYVATASADFRVCFSVIGTASHRSFAGATPAGHAADTDALDEAVVRAMVSKSAHNTQDKKWLFAMSCCREALRPNTAKTTQKDSDRRPMFNDVRMGDFIIVKSCGQITCYHYDNHYLKGDYNTGV